MAVADAEGEALDLQALLENELKVLPFAQDEFPVEGHVLQAVGLPPSDLLDVDPGFRAGTSLILILPGPLATVLQTRVSGTLDRRGRLGPLLLDNPQGVSGARPAS